MPVKFRCHHCNTFMGVSLRKRGQAVDCPQCGRRIQVPEQDQEYSNEIETASLLSDPDLSSALATLEQSPESSADSAEFSTTPSIIVDEQAIPPKPNLVEELSHFAPVAAVEEVPSGELEITEPLTPVAASRNLKDKNTTGRKTLFQQSIAAIVILAVGMMIGAMAFSSRESTTSEAPAIEQEKIATAEHTESESLPTAKLIGRVLIKTSQSNSPDAGAVVLWIPAQRVGEITIPAMGLRPGDSQEDFEIQQAALKAMGLFAERTDRDGQFRFEVPVDEQAKQGMLFVLSRFAPQNAGMTTAQWSVPKRKLATVLASPEEWIGQRAWHFQMLETTEAVLTQPVEVLFVEP